jgi:hypothetical protein
MLELASSPSFAKNILVRKSFRTETDETYHSRRLSTITDWGRRVLQVMHSSRICSHLWGRDIDNTVGTSALRRLTAYGRAFCMAVLEPRRLVIPTQAFVFRVVKRAQIRRAPCIICQGGICIQSGLNSIADSICRCPSAATHSIMAAYVDEVLTQCKSST